MNTCSTRTRCGAAILFSGVLVLGGLTLTGEATAGQEVSGNPRCSALGYEHTYKVESPGAGTYAVERDGITARLTVGTHPDRADPNRDNAIVDHEVSAIDVAVVVKGGDGATVYRSSSDGSLEPPPLHAPVVSSGKWPTISHFQLCWNEPAPQPELGRLAVTKVVMGEGAPTDGDYEICVSPVGEDGRRCDRVTANATALFDDLPPGPYVITETDPGPRFSVEGSGVVVTVGNEATTRATITNTWIPIPPNEQFGEVVITKVVSGEGAPTDDEYEICLQGPAPSTSMTCTTIVGASTWTFEDLMPGTYQVSETDPGADYDVVISDATVEVAIGEGTTTTVTNDYVGQQPETPTVPDQGVSPGTAVAPETPAAPQTPGAPTVPTDAADQVTLPATGSESIVAVIAAIVLATGIALTLLGRQRAPRHAGRSGYQAISGTP